MTPPGNEPPRKGGWRPPVSTSKPRRPEPPAGSSPGAPPGREQAPRKTGRPSGNNAEPMRPPVRKPAPTDDRPLTEGKPRPAQPPANAPRPTAPRSKAAEIPHAHHPRPFDPAAQRRAEAASDRPPLRRGTFHVGRGNEGPSLVSRGERTLFWTLLAAVLAMTIYLVRYRERVDAHFASRTLAVPLSDAAAGDASPLTLYIANDSTGALDPHPLSYPLPRDPNTRARVVLEKLLAEYTAPTSSHQLKPEAPGVESVDEVFLSPVPGQPGTMLATVDLTPAFVRSHPSGVEPESLTLLSMIATLHAALPEVTQVHFLVNGEPHTTLAGHADLTHTYLAAAAQVAPVEGRP